MRSLEQKSHARRAARGAQRLAVVAIATIASLVAAAGCASRSARPAEPAAAPAAPPQGTAGTEAAAGGDAPPKRFPTPSGQCIFLRTIEDWKAVDPYRILVRTKVSGWQWEVLLDRRCSDILYANALEWDTPDSRVCDYRRDAIAVPGDRCTIGAIRAYEAAAEPAPAKGERIE